MTFGQSPTQSFGQHTVFSRLNRAEIEYISIRPLCPLHKHSAPRYCEHSHSDRPLSQVRKNAYREWRLDQNWPLVRLLCRAHLAGFGGDSGAK